MKNQLNIAGKVFFIFRRRKTGLKYSLGCLHYLLED